MVLSKGKPIVLGEVGNPPTLDILNNQPNWGYWVIWAGMVRNLTKKQHQELVNDPRMLSLEDPAYWEVMASFRKACGLPLLPLKDKYPVNFSGQWIFNEEKSDVGNRGVGNVPYEMDIYHDDDLLDVKKVMIVEWEDDRITNEEIMLDGTEMKSEFFNSPRISKANWDEASQSVIINSTVKIERGGRSFEMKSTEEWSLQEDGNILKIVQTSTSYRGEEVKLSLVYDKL
jgi:hypothetical protein